jgi:serine/alanine adding enzyme
VSTLDAITNSYSNCKNVSYDENGNYIPLIRVRSKIFGNKIISLPFMDVGGIFGSSKNSFKILLKKIVESFKDTRIEIKLNDIEKNFQGFYRELESLGFGVRKAKQQFYILIENPETKWKKFHKHTRNDIRKAEKSSLKIVPINNDSELKKFYTLYFDEMKRFGTPPHSRKFFLNLAHELKDKFYGLNCYKDNKLIASTVLVKSEEVAYLWFNVSDQKYRNFRPNDLLYWANVKEAYREKISFIDSGQIDLNPQDKRSEGLLKFKQKWLGESHQKYLFTYPSEESESSKKEKLKKFRKIWSLLPNPIIKLIGPKICSELGN